MRPLLAGLAATLVSIAAAVSGADAPASAAQTYALRLHPGQDLKQEILRFAKAHDLKAAAILTCVGSLTRAVIRYANQKDAVTFDGHFEIVSLVGTFAADGGHLHISVSDKVGRTVGGHVMDGSTIYTTAEIVITSSAGLRFLREKDTETTFDELVVRSR